MDAGKEDGLLCGTTPVKRGDGVVGTPRSIPERDATELSDGGVARRVDAGICDGGNAERICILLSGANFSRRCLSCSISDAVSFHSDTVCDPKSTSAMVSIRGTVAFSAG